MQLFDSHVIHCIHVLMAIRIYTPAIDDDDDNKFIQLASFNIHDDACGSARCLWILVQCHNTHTYTHWMDLDAIATAAPDH